MLEKFKKLKENLLDVLSYAIVAMLFVPFFISAIKADTSGVGVAVIAFAIVALIALVGFYIAFNIKRMIAKNKQEEQPKEYSRIKKLIMAITPFAFYFAYLIGYGVYIGARYYVFDDNMLACFCGVTFVFLLSDMLLYDYKQVLRSKTPILVLVAFLLATIIENISPLILVPIVAIAELVLIIIFAILQNKKQFFRALTKKQIVVSVILLVLVSAVSLGLSSASNSIKKSRSADIIESVKSKSFKAASKESTYRGMIIDELGQMAKLDEDDKSEDAYYGSLDVVFSWYGLGEAKLISGSVYGMERDENNEVIALIGGKDKYVITDKLPEYVTLHKYLPYRDEYLTLYKKAGLPTNQVTQYAVDTGIFYSDNSSKKLVQISSDYEITHFDLYGKSRGYEHMLEPIFLYINDVPGAITDVEELLAEWDKHWEYGTIDKTSMSSEFTKYGITYKIQTYSQGQNYNFVRVSADCDVTYEFDLNEWPKEYKEFIENTEE